MSPSVFALVIAAAVLHAGWNALVKRNDDPFVGMMAVCIYGGAIAAGAVALLSMPPLAAWPYLAASIGLHVVYFWLVGLVYRHADLSTAYPLMRGAAPLAALALAALFLGETPSLAASLCVGLIALGVGALALGGGPASLERALPLAMAVAISIALYTVTDAAGARITGRGAAGAFAFNGASDAATGVALAALSTVGRGTGVLRDAVSRWKSGLAGGAAAFVGYATVVYAMTEAPVAIVAALRETSVLFAALIGVAAFGEPMGRKKAAAVALIVVGGAALRLI